MTGLHVDGTPQSIEERTEQLAALHRQIFGTNGRSETPPLSDLDGALLDRARRATNGGKFDALWSGDTSRYASQSEADLALCSMLAYWTGNDRAWIDRLFRQSELMPGNGMSAVASARMAN